MSSDSEDTGVQCEHLPSSATARLKRQLFIAAGVVTGLVLLTSFCVPHSPTTAGELYGTYILDCNLVREELILRPDGTFSQTATVKATADEVSAKGNWEYRLRKSHGVRFGDVRFTDGFIIMLKRPDTLDPDYAQPKPGCSVLCAEYWYGQLILGRVDDWPEWRKVK
jgi:hypothetical protein